MVAPDLPDLLVAATQRGVDVYFENVGGRGIRDGRIRYREDIVDGFENTPEAFAGLLRGQNFGKLIIRVSD